MAGQTLLTTILINARTGNGFSQVGNTLTELGSIVNGISQHLIDFGEDSIKVYRNYEKSMTDAEVALSTTYGRGTRELNGVMTQLDAAATDWAATTIFHTNDVGNAISEAAHAGWDFDQIMSGIPAAMQLAQAGGLDLSEAVNYIAKATSAAGIGFEDMGGFIDNWTFAANSSASTIDEFGQAMLRMGSTMRFTGNTEELMTLIAVTANAGSVGSEAGTMIRNSMIRLIAPTDKAQEAMEQLGATSEETAGLMEDQELAAANARLAAEGFSAYDSKGNLKNILDIYRELYVALGEVAGGYENIETNEDALGILSAIFPTRTITEALTLLRGAADSYDGLYDAMRRGEGEGYGAYAAETMMDTLDGKILTFESKIERLQQLVGGELAPQAINVMDAIGGIADSISGLDDDKFSMLVGAAEGIALAGPGMLAVGGALRFIGLLATPTGAAATAVVALAAGLGALNAYSEAEFMDNFGDMALDLAALKENIEGITTSADTDLAPIRELSSQLQELSTQYTETKTAFSTSLATALLTGTELNEQQIIDLKAKGAEIQGYVIEGINTSETKSLGFLNAITPDYDSMTEEQQQAYDNMYGWLSDYYGGLEAQATAIGQKLQNDIFSALAGDHTITPEEADQIKADLEEYDRIVAEWQEEKSQQAFMAMEEKAHSVSYDTIEQYMTELSESYEADKAQDETTFAQESAKQRQAASAAAGHELTLDEWHATPEYQELLGNYQEQVSTQRDQQYGQLAQVAFSTLLGDSALADSWKFAQRVMAEAPRDKSGNVDYDNIDWAGYIAEGAVPSTFYQDLRELQKGSGFLGLGKSRLGSLLETFQNIPGIAEMYSMFTGGFFDGSGLGNLQISAADFQQRYGGWTGSGIFGEFNEGYGPDLGQGPEVEVTPRVDQEELDAQLSGKDGGRDLELKPRVDQGELDTELTTSQGGHDLELTPHVDSETLNSELASTQGGHDLELIPHVDTPPDVEPMPLLLTPYVEGTDAIAGLEDQGVEVSVDGDATELTATIDGYDGQTLVEYLNGDATNLHAVIMDENGVVLTERVYGNTAALGNAISAYNGRTITVNIRGNRLFAEGGRATTASIFGEAGPEWAIPEEHSERTARLLDAARAASGFTWSEIIGRFGGLNANPDNTATTFVYSPTINAQNASGVEQVLRDDKRRMEKWFEEKQMRDRAEVYA